MPHDDDAHATDAARTRGIDAAGSADGEADGVARLARLCEEAEAPVRRLLLTRGVALRPADDGTWRLANVVPLDRVRAAPLVDDATAGPHDAPVDVDALLRRHGLLPFAVVTTSAIAPPRGRLVSAAGTLGWHPPLERLDGPALTDHRTARATLRLRFALDAIEHHAVRAAEGYAAAAQTARRLAALFGARDLGTVAGQLAPLMELDALLAAARGAYGAIAALLWATWDEPAGDRRRAPRRTARPAARASFDVRVIACRGAPAELREALLTSWDSWGASIASHRGWLARLAAGDLAPVPLRVARIEPTTPFHAPVWTVGVPIPDAPTRSPRGRPSFSRRLEALEWSGALATEVARVAARTTLAIVG